MTTTTTPTIRVRYSSIDRFSQSRSFKTVESARKYAEKWVGPNPDMSVNYNYAVSPDGMGKVTANISMETLFGVTNGDDSVYPAGSGGQF